ncbi:hypothetical protein, partial [Rathayibacter sp. AY2B1]|uniref:hypothetical protein n=1 Tax=Rathayibacter sp. AY2B1 TaxID=2080568 RepID=UPI001CA4EE52
PVSTGTTIDRSDGRCQGPIRAVLDGTRADRSGGGAALAIGGHREAAEAGSTAVPEVIATLASVGGRGAEMSSSSTVLSGSSSNRSVGVGCRA